MKLSVVIPAYNEEGNIENTVKEISKTLQAENIDHEILVVNDNSKDETLPILESLTNEIPTLRFITNLGPNGYGYACQVGLNNFSGDCVVVTMADLSDDPRDIVKFYRTLVAGDCDMVFGNRWAKDAIVTGYPRNKLWLNRLVNNVIAFLFFTTYRDMTNGFKMFRRETLAGLRPFLTGQFSFALELPLKALIRGYSYKVVPNNWHGRTVGESNLKIKQMFFRYTFILLYCLIERCFSMGDYKKNNCLSRGGSDK